MAGKLLFPIPDRGLDERLYRVRAKTVLVWGDSDRVIPPAHGEAFCRDIAGAELIRGRPHSDRRAAGRGGRRAAAARVRSRENPCPIPPPKSSTSFLAVFRGQILYAGTVLGVFDRLTGDQDVSAPQLASAIGADPSLLYRLLRAMAAIGLLTENESKAFRLTPAGALLRADHPRSLRAMALVTQGPEAYAAWKHLVPIIRDGRPDGFLRELGVTVWEYANANPAYGALLNEAMTSRSTVQTELALAALQGIDFSAINTFCDVGGGHGCFVCGFLRAYPHLTGVVFDRPQVVAETDLLWGPKLGLAER